MSTPPIATEGGGGYIATEGGGGYIALEGGAGSIGPFARVQATQAGFYRGDYKDIGDVFDVLTSADFSDSTVSQVPVGNPDYPVMGWMLIVPPSTPLFSWAYSGYSTPRNSPRRTVQ